MFKIGDKVKVLYKYNIKYPKGRVFVITDFAPLTEDDECENCGYYEDENQDKHWLNDGGSWWCCENCVELYKVKTHLPDFL